MVRIWGIVEYDGTAYGGWQRQNNADSVQERLETALASLLGSPTRVTGAGRTDRGVHAYGQSCHFDCDTRIPPEKIAYALNYLLPDDIRMKRSQLAPPSFHARFSALGKWYRYQIYRHPMKSPLLDRQAWHIPYREWDLSRMQSALSCLLGTHDYTAFMAAGNQTKNPVRTITKATLSEQDGLTTLSLYGDGFLYNMVRIIAGTLADIGRGRLSADTFSRMLATRDRTLGGSTAPPRGLCLMEVYYREDGLENLGMLSQTL